MLKVVFVGLSTSSFVTGEVFFILNIITAMTVVKTVVVMNITEIKTNIIVFLDCCIFGRDSGFSITTGNSFTATVIF